MFSFLAPHYRIRRVQDLTLDYLRRLGVDSLLLDADCTLKRYRSEDCAPGVRPWLEELRAAGIRMCLVSNGLGPRIERFAASVALPFVAQAMKPLPTGCRRAMREHDFDPSRTAMVGDQLFADILAGHWAGLITIMVDAVHPEEERWFTRMKRAPEKFILARIQSGWLPEPPRQSVKSEMTGT